MPDAKPIEFRSLIPNMLVKDIAAAVAFYTEKLGFTVTIDGTSDNFVVLAKDAVTIGVIGSKTGLGHGWCGLTVSDPAALFTQYQAAGITILRPLETWGNHSEFSIKDLDGNRIDVMSDDAEA